MTITSSLWRLLFFCAVFLWQPLEHSVALAQTVDVNAKILSETRTISNQRPTWLLIVLDVPTGYQLRQPDQLTLKLSPGLKLTQTLWPQRWPTDAGIRLFKDNVAILVEVTAEDQAPFYQISLSQTVDLCPQTGDCQTTDFSARLTLSSGKGMLLDDNRTAFMVARQQATHISPWRGVAERNGQTITHTVYISDAEKAAFGTIDLSILDRKGTISDSQDQMNFIYEDTDNKEHSNLYIRTINSDGKTTIYRLQNSVIAAHQPTLEQNNSPITASGDDHLTLWTAVISALVGGLVLNLMPCVFPILAMKAFSLIQAGSQSRQAMVEDGISYTLGVLSTFLVVAGILISLQGLGQQIGWGFQLQNPLFVMSLIIIMLLVALNLLGLFEVQMPQSINRLLGNAHSSNAFGTGVLATVMATPCTAPFMGTALGFALGQPPIIALTIFLSLGLGMALPYLALSLWPKLATMMPKPGPWMARFKKWLSLPVFATIIWLAWVYYLQTGGAGIAFLAGVLLIGFALAISIKATAKRGILVKIILFSLTFGGLHVLWDISKDKLEVATSGDIKPLADDIETVAFSQQNLAFYARQGRPIFIDFTASWCITCKVTEKLVLQTESFKDLLRQHGLVFMIADWTNPNDEIDAFLKARGRQGIPYYLIIPNDGRDEIKLPDILTLQSVKNALE